ncbi:MAG: exodeoxyribonuclease V subunit gamma [Desulfopila sp.]|jgi:exodeoxyribonuclease V gamma subunit|nr:exodeoxyribonuclease V subunit gamma [Desulfopila sp.]
MFFLHASNKTENLLLHMAKVIEALPPDSIFESEYILIQSQGMERMISQYMASYFTVWCNYRFLLPVTFLRDIAARLGLEITPDAYDRSTLCWRLEKELRHVDDCDPLRHYLQGDQVEVKRFQLAWQLANIFDQYQLMRPFMLRSWQSGTTVGTSSAEKWQMLLWNRLTSTESGDRHRGELLHEVTAALHEAAHTKPALFSLPRRISVFGIHILPPFFLDCLRSLAEHCDVHLFLLSPCRKYWGDMDRRNELRAAYQDAAAHHPLLASLGKQGRDFQELLLEKIDIEKEFVSYEDPLENGQGTLLQRLQSDLLRGALPDSTQGGCDNGGENLGDGSLRCVSCHSKKRELEVLRDHILHILDCDHEMQLSDIVVMAPDIQQYAAYIPAIFDDIQHSIADRSLSHRNRYVAVFQEFLEVFSGRFGWSEVLDLLEKKEVFPQFGLRSSDFERLRHWVVSSGIRWGLSPRLTEQEGRSCPENSWQSGLERLLMGYAIDVEEEVAGVFPFSDIEGGEAKILGGLCRFIALLEDARASFSSSHTLERWFLLLQQYGELLFAHGDDKNLHEFYEILRQLVTHAEFHDGLVCFEVVRKWLQNSSVESRSASGFLKGQLTFCSMLPMRSIPFKAVCLLGMNYGVFPASDPVVTFDLMKNNPLPGDRSLRADDRYQFLEVLLAARQSLYISYIGQSLQNNDSIPPSVAVTELLEMLENYGLSGLVEVHPLHSFSRRYFSGAERLFSYSEHDFLLARGREEHEEQQQQHWWTGRIPRSECTSVDVADLFRFFWHPQQYFLQRCMGVALMREERSPEESEIFHSSGLQKYLVDELLYQKIISAEVVLHLQKRLRFDGLWPLGTPGDVFFEEKHKEMQTFAARVLMENMGERLADIVVEKKVGPYHLSGTLGNRFEGGLMSMRYADLQGKDLLGGWLMFLLGSLYDIPVAKIVMKNMRVVFEAGVSQGPSLLELVELYCQGKEKPCRLLLGAAMDYCGQQRKTRSRVSPLQKARAALAASLENGYDPAWTLLYGDSAVEATVNGDFVALSEKILCPLWSSIS